MSELQRHIEANETEEARHVEAGEAEMAEHINNTRSLPELQAEVEVAVHRAERATALRDVVFGICVFGALLLSAFTIIASRNAAADNGHRIDVLSEELKDARELLLVEAQDDEELLVCQSRFDAALRLTSFEPLASIGALVTIIVTIPSGPERDAAVGNSIQELSDRVDETRQAIAALAEWNNDPLKLPCPI